MSHKSSIILFAVLILLVYVSIRVDTAPSSVKTPASDSGFSLDRAYVHLQQIARMPHSIGTAENARVRSYIEATCRELGLEVEIQHTTAIVPDGLVVAAGNVYNIIARIRGEDNSKTVLVTAHYDSQPNAVGAGDDGAGVAAMLETARILKHSKRLKNDILFLFTDGEEEGMLGAYGFVQNSPLLKEVGVVLNFEGRGNAGIIHMFETNPGNGWVISMYARSAAHPYANSLNYEVYRNLPNNTDYSVFKMAGIAGLNNAFIEGAVNYHSMTDKPENLDRGTFQEDGDNMLSLVRYIGDSKIQETKRKDVTYFNVIGSWMVRYPASLNILFLVFTNLLLLAYLLNGYRAGKITGPAFFRGVVVFPLTLVGLFGLNYLLLRVIWAAYPLYDHFYGHNSYNVYYYFFGMTVLGLTVFSLIYGRALQKSNADSLVAAILVIGILVTDVLYTAAPTAIYFLCFPLLAVLVGQWFTYRRKAEGHDPSWRKSSLQLLFLLPAIVLLSPVIYSTFTAFGLSDQVSAVLILLGLFAGLLLPVFAGVLRAYGWVIAGLGFACFLVVLGVAHLKSGYTEQHPLQTNLRYLLESDSGRAYWTSDYPAADSWNRQFFRQDHVPRPPLYFQPKLINDAPLLPIPAPVLTRKRDTVEEGQRKVWFHCQGRQEALSAQIVFSDSTLVRRLVVEGRGVPVRGEGYHYFRYIGLEKEGFDFEVEMAPISPLVITLVDRSLGLPVSEGFNTKYPLDVIPGPDYNSNTVQVVRRYRF